MSKRTTCTQSKDILNPTTEEFRRVCKRKNVFSSNRAQFITVTCMSCTNERICYSHTQTPIDCNTCGTVLLIPSGGLASLGEQASFVTLKRDF